MQAGSKKLLLALSVDGKELFFYRIKELVSKKKKLRLFLEVTRSIHLVTSCECMERRKCKCSIFSKYASNLVGCKVAQMYISTKIYDREANLASQQGSFIGSQNGEQTQQNCLGHNQHRDLTYILKYYILKEGNLLCVV